MYDAVIVGSRCSGAPLGMLLAQQGHRVLMVDRAKFPSDTMSTHFIQAPGTARLARWGLLDEVVATGCPAVTKAVMSLSPDTDSMEFDIPLPAGLSGLTAPRRTILDEILVRAAVRAGAELAEGVSVDSLVRDGGRVVGVSGHDAEGAFEARAPFVIGADGRNSVVAREVDTPLVRNEGSTSAGYYTYYRNLEMNDSVEAYLHDDHFAVVNPTNYGLTVVGVAWPPDRFSSLRRDIEGNFLSALDSMGEIGARVRAAERAERFVGLADVPNFLRKACGPGWALAGDACCHKDPVPADGISDAFRSAEFLAEAIDEALRSGDEDAALSRYEERHARVAVPLLDAAVRSARFDLTPQQRFEAFFEIRAHDLEEANELMAAPATA